jgi:hypothetical protein
MIFFSYIETYSENNYRCDTFQGDPRGFQKESICHKVLNSKWRGEGGGVLAMIFSFQRGDSLSKCVIFTLFWKKKLFKKGRDKLEN